MFEEPAAGGRHHRFAAVAAGLGSIPRLAANDREIYGRKLRFAEAEQRIARCYRPYHAALSALIQEDAGALRRLPADRLPFDALGRRGKASAISAARGVDFVLGDCFGASCADAVTAAAEDASPQGGRQCPPATIPIPAAM